MQGSFYVYGSQQLKNLKNDAENVEVGQSKNEMLVTFPDLNSGVNYSVKICTLINGCIISTKYASIKPFNEE